MANIQDVYIAQNTLLDIGDNSQQIRTYNKNNLLNSANVINENNINNKNTPLQNENTINNIDNNKEEVNIQQNKKSIKKEDLDIKEKPKNEPIVETFMNIYNEQKKRNLINEEQRNLNNEEQRNLDNEEQRNLANKNKQLNTPRKQTKPFIREIYEEIPLKEKNKFLIELSNIFQRTNAVNNYIKYNYRDLKDKLLDIMEYIRDNRIPLNSIRYDFTKFVTYETLSKDNKPQGWPSRKSFEYIIKILLTDSLTDKIGHFQKLMTSNKRNNVILFSIMKNKEDEEHFISALSGKYKSIEYKSIFGGKKKTRKIKNNKKTLVTRKTRSTKSYKPITTRSIKKSNKNITRRR